MLKNNRKIKYILIVVIVLVLVLTVFPLLIHVAFRADVGSEFLKVKWTAGEFLNFYGAILSFIGTVSLSILALYQNALFQKNNERLMKLQNVPYFSNVNLFVMIQSTFKKDTNPTGGDIALHLEGAKEGVLCECLIENMSNFPIYQIQGKFQAWDNISHYWAGIIGSDECTCVKKVIAPGDRSDNKLRVSVMFSWMQLKIMGFSDKKCGVLLSFKNTNGLETQGRLVYFRESNRWLFELIPLEINDVLNS